MVQRGNKIFDKFFIFVSDVLIVTGEFSYVSTKIKKTRLRTEIVYASHSASINFGKIIFMYFTHLHSWKMKNTYRGIDDYIKERDLENPREL